MNDMTNSALRSAGVNRSTIREAIRVLEENGLVRRNGQSTFHRRNGQSTFHDSSKSPSRAACRNVEMTRSSSSLRFAAKPNVHAAEFLVRCVPDQLLDRTGIGRLPHNREHGSYFGP